MFTHTLTTVVFASDMHCIESCGSCTLILLYYTIVLTSLHTLISGDHTEQEVVVGDDSPIKVAQIKCWIHSERGELI